MREGGITITASDTSTCAVSSLLLRILTPRPAQAASSTSPHLVLPHPAPQPPPQPRMMPLVNDLVPAIMALRPRFAVCARRAAGEKASPRALHGYDDDEETARGMARLFAEVGEAYVGLIATGEDSVLEPVQALLEVAAHADDDVCSTSFLFWHSLSEKASDVCACVMMRQRGAQCFVLCVC